MNVGATWSWFRQLTNSSSSWLQRLGVLALMSMVLVALIDAIGSKLFHWPLPGSTELTSVIQVTSIAAGLAASKIAGRHIMIDMFISVLPRRGRAALEAFNSFLGLGLFVVAGWMTCEYGLSLLGSGTKTLLLEIPLYPFALWISLCCIPMCCVIIIALLNSVGRVLKK